ncbi:aconitase X catalytic domain-containing protein [Georgenia halophila]|uniref:Aconitase X catalytic domain-containing protein n=1 Tax=Georgenia halophila TaxID=620889 RepID=A0ABP8KTB2_9MICO
MFLTAEQQAMADGEQGEAVAAAMRILVRYGEIMDAEGLVEVASAAGANIYGPRHAVPLGTDDPRALFNRFSLNTDAPLESPGTRVHSCQLIGPMDRETPEVQDMPRAAVDRVEASQAYLEGLGVSLLNTCTPYQVGFLPTLGDHCAWMESSAVVFINSVIGARTNTEGRESAAASMLTGLTPNAGLHLDVNRRADVRVRVRTPMSDTFAWNVLGYWLGAAVEDDAVPVLDGIDTVPDLVQLKQLGAAAASSGDTELFHIPGVTPECASVEQVLVDGAAEVTFGPDELRQTVERLNVTRTGDDVDFVMIGCPHASYEQLQQVAAMVDGRRLSPDVALWVFTPSALRERARQEGLLATIERSGARVLSDTCPAIGQFLPKGTRRFATDSAKQVHYLPAIMGVEGAFATTAQCVAAAVDGRLPS